jgi:SAM-dependent methyltransferase
MAETGKAHDRRLAEGWFDKYAPEDRSGLDLLPGWDRLNQTFRVFGPEYGDGEVSRLDSIGDEKFWTVYASYTLAYIMDYATAIRNWYRVLKTGGHLIILVPHRDLYEKKLELPSRWNRGHTAFWMPETNGDYTYSLRHTVLDAIPQCDVVSLQTLDFGYNPNGDDHPIGEYSIEMIVKKV